MTQISLNYDLPVTRIDTKQANSDNEAYVGIYIEIIGTEAEDRLREIIKEFEKVDLDFEQIAEQLELDEDEEITEKDLEEIGVKTSKVLDVEWNINPDTGLPQEEQVVYIYTEYAQEFLDRIKDAEFNPDGTLKPEIHPDQYDLF